MDVKDIPIAGGIGTLASSFGDVILYGGDHVIDALFFIVSTIDLWLPFASRLTSVAQVVDWLPEDALQRLVLVLTAIAVVVYAYRILKRWKNRQ